MKHQERINEMMRRAGQEIPDKPTEPSDEVKLLRARLILEEAFETIEAMGVTVYDQDWFPLQFHLLEFEVNGQFDMQEVVDGCGDVSVVTIGTLSACGVDAGPVLEEIDQNNLAKFSGDGHRDEHGKWIKPTGHKPPDIAGVLAKQGYSLDTA